MNNLGKLASKLQPKWSSLYDLIKLQGVSATLQDPDTQETVVVHVDRISLSSPRLRDEIASTRFHLASVSSSDLSVLHDPEAGVPH